MANRNPLTLSRQELYELVWSHPVREVAQQIGLSDVAVAKRCRQVQVPVPPRGYWARVAAGQTPKRTPLPKYRDGSAGPRQKMRTSVLERTDPVGSGYAARRVDREHAEPTVTFYTSGRADKAKKAVDAKDSPPEPFRAALDARLSTLPVSADAPESWFAQGDITLSPPAWPESLRTPARLPAIAVHSKTSLLRARRIATHLVQVITQLGWRFNAKTLDPSEPTYRRRYEDPVDIERRAAHFLVEGERLFVSITERQTRTERPLSAEEEKERRRNPSLFYYRDRYRYHPSGELTVQVSSSAGHGGFASFRDTKRVPLEMRIEDVVRCLLQGALDIKRRRLEREEAAERERQAALQRERMRKTREAHAQLIRRFEAEAGAWERAQRLRRYLRAARRSLAPGSCVQVVLENECVDLLRIGEQFADQLDPLHSASRTVQFFDGTDPYGTGHGYDSDDAKLRKFVARILGGDWRCAPKRVMSATDSEERTEAALFPDE